MPSHVKCPTCSTILQLPDTSSPGGMFRCPKCTTVLRVPGQASGPPPSSVKKPPLPVTPPVPRSAPPVLATPSSRSQVAPPVRRSKASKSAPPKTPAEGLIASLPPRWHKWKSNRRLLAGILGCTGLLFLVCGGGITYGIYQLFHTSGPIKQTIESAKQELKEDQVKQDAQAKAPENVLDVSFIPPGCNAAFVIQPARIARSPSPLLPSREERERLIDQGIQSTGIDFSKVGQFIVILEPAPKGQSRRPPGMPRPLPRNRPPGPPAPSGADEPVPFIAAAILHFTEPVDDMAILVKTLHQMDRVQLGGKTYFRSKTEKQDGQPLAGHFDGDRTVLLGPEPMLKKMLDAQSAASPLGEKLREFGLEHDLFGVFLVQPIKSMLKDLVQSPTAQKQFPTAKTLNEDLLAVRLTANLNGDKLMRIILEGRDDTAAKNLEELAEALLNLSKVMYPQIKPIIQKETSPEIAANVVKVTDQFLKKDGVTVIREGKSVTIALNKPKDL